MGLFEFLTNIKNKVGSNDANVKPIQIAENGGIDYDATLKLVQHLPKKPFERLFGRNIEIDTDTTNPTTGEITTERVAKFQPGLFNDLASGAKENYTTGFAADNLQDHIGTEGQNKGVAYRIGEGAGTLGRGLRRGLGALGRFADTPLGRAAITAGIVGLTGGSGLQALTYGGTAGVGNKVNRMKDRAYRDSLIDSAQQSRIGQPDWINLSSEQKQTELNNIANQINSYRGYIGDDVYSQMIQAQQLRDNAQYRNMLLNTQMKNQEAEIEQRKAEMARKAEQDRIDNYYKGQQIAQGWADIENDKNNKKAGRIMPASSATGLSGTQQGINQMTTLMEQIPKFAKRGLTGPVGSLRRFNPYDADAQAFQQYVNTYKQVIGKGLEGGVLRKEDEAKYEKIIPRMGDTEEVLMRKAQQLQQMLVEKYNTDLKSLYNAGYDTGNFSYLGTQRTTNNSKSGVTKSGIKYEVIE